jgi:hypothetical protein
MVMRQEKLLRMGVALMRNCFLWVGTMMLVLSPIVVAQTPWETYLEYPSPENATLVRNAQYTDSSVRDQSLAWDLSLLEVQVISRDREAVRLAFRLFAESDGEYSEILDIMLGRLIRIDPMLFLEELKGQEQNTKEMGGLLGNVGQEYVDRLGGRIYEVEQRIAALMTVTDPELLEIRAACVDELNSMLE